MLCSAASKGSELQEEEVWPQQPVEAKEEDLGWSMV
ncbi:Ubiquitin supergroup [Prunus dulcis]|uniref:Ubiquitin supergroup n=1 Tax=Prunus dulcis TaxID=3755 RepID=A0A5H2XM58_PRUDU|nr:Ubiquitin supergroup [Prunus dulcis]